MVRRRRLLAACLAAAFLTFAPTDARAASSGCDGGGFFEGCPGTSATTDGSGVDVTGVVTIEKPGSDSKSERPHAPDAPGGGARPLTFAELQALDPDLCFAALDCDTTTAGGVTDPQPAEDGEPPAVVTIADVARFLPATIRLSCEPDGWAVVGVPANFWVDVAPIEVDGQLLGGPAQVRFAPTAYRWDYGDGTIRTTTVPGSSWEDLGQEELTRTPTSHVYRQRADERASVTVIYAAQYRVADGPWIAVAGAVLGATPQERVLVVTERTALTTPA